MLLIVHKRRMFGTQRKAALSGVVVEVAQVSLHSFGSPADVPVCAVKGLVELLAGSSLLEKLGAAVEWCVKGGIDDIAMIAEVGAEEDFAEALGLKQLKAKQLIKRLAVA